MTRYGMREDAMQRLAGLLADAIKGKTVTDAVHALRASYSTLQYV
jgi:glycine/serine hydroxymethyltransferase